MPANPPPACRPWHGRHHPPVRRRMRPRSPSGRPTAAPTSPPAPPRRQGAGGSTSRLATATSPVAPEAVTLERRPCSRSRARTGPSRSPPAPTPCGSVPTARCPGRPRRQLDHVHSRSRSTTELDRDPRRRRPAVGVRLLRQRAGPRRPADGSRGADRHGAPDGPGVVDGRDLARGRRTRCAVPDRSGNGRDRPRPRARRRSQVPVRARRPRLARRHVTGRAGPCSAMRRRVARSVASSCRSVRAATSCRGRTVSCGARCLRRPGAERAGRDRSLDVDRRGRGRPRRPSSAPSWSWTTRPGCWCRSSRPSGATDRVQRAAPRVASSTS